MDIKEQIKEGVTFKGTWRAYVNGKLTHEYHNVITNGLRELVLSGMAGESSIGAALTITHQQLGTGTTAVSVTDTALETPSAPTKIALTTMTRSGTTLLITAFWDVGQATGVWKEFGLWANTLLINHMACDEVVTANDTLTFDGEIDMG